MKKTELESKLAYIEKELEKLLTVLNKNQEEYAEEITKECGRKFNCSDTWPYKVGIASATIENILQDILTRRF